MSLKPIRYARGGKVYWVVRVGKKLSGGRAARKHYFKTRGDANNFITNLLDARKRLGQSAFTLTLEQQAEAVKAFERLKPLGLSLSAVLDAYFKTNGNGKPCPLFKDFAESYVAVRVNSCKSHTLATYRSELKPPVKEFGKLRLNEIHQSDIEEWAADLDFAPRTISNLLDTLTTVFNDGVRKEHISRNPAMFVPRPKPANNPPGILEPEQAKRLLSAAKRLRPQLVPALAIALFAGLRRSEICSLTGRHLLMKDRLIEVPASVAKTRQRRLVTIRDNLALWLRDAPRDKTPLAITTNPDVFGDWVHQLAAEAGILNWPHNGMRHSFASYLYALIRNEAIVAAEMGNSPNVVIRNYRAVVRPALAKAYFGIVPHGSATRRRLGKRALLA